MPEKFKNKYKIGSTRLRNWDYRWAGCYFITICTKNRENYLVKIINGEMILSNTGLLADVLWYEIKNHVKNIELDAFVVMPNHVHGLIIINDSVDENCRNRACPVSTEADENQTIGQQRFQNIGKNSLSSIIGSYKSAVTKHANRLGFDFGWQSRFIDHIVRDNKSYQNIKNYINSNIENWNNDKFCSKI